MRKVISNLAISLDSFIEGPNGEIDWLVRAPTMDFGDILTDILTDKDAIFYRRISYEKWGHYHPEAGSPKLKAAYEMLHSKNQVGTLAFTKGRWQQRYFYQFRYQRKSARHQAAARQKHLALWWSETHHYPIEHRPGRQLPARSSPGNPGKREAAISEP